MPTITIATAAITPPIKLSNLKAITHRIHPPQLLAITLIPLPRLS
jgi:hypothetical protein